MTANLPAPRSSLIGRERDVSEVTKLLLEGPERLVTLTGVGVCGKTLLALQVAFERWRVGPGWYALAVLLPVTIAGTAAGINVLLGAPAPAAAQLRAWPSLVSTFLLLLLVPGIGGTWEEPGWRGYALSSLQARSPALSASIVLGLLWAGWHLPLFLVRIIPWSDAVLIVG